MGQCCSSVSDSPSPEKSSSARQDSRHALRHFKFIRKLGQGSWSTVYLVERLADGQRYALKQTELEELDEPLRRIAVNEVRVMASLEPHPHVTHTLEAFLDAGHKLCLVMEVVPNGELAHIIEKHAERDTLLPEGDIWRYFIQIALGLQFLHSHGILHRDLKPQNILITAEGQLKLADLGIAHVAHGDGTTKVRIGTPHYMAPEVWRRDPYSFPADMWSLGCCLHEMCSRRPLFLADSERAIESRVIAGVVPPISKRYSQELRDLINDLLQYNPQDRPTVQQVLSCTAVRSRMEAMADESWASMCNVSQLETRGSSKLLDPIELPTDLSLLNLRLPPSRYRVGDGLVNVLRAESMPEDLPLLPGPPGGPLHSSSSASSLRSAGQSADRAQHAQRMQSMPEAATSAASLPAQHAQHVTISSPRGLAMARASSSATTAGMSSSGSCALSVADTAWEGAGSGGGRAFGTGGSGAGAGAGAGKAYVSPFAAASEEWAAAHAQGAAAAVAATAGRGVAVSGPSQDVGL